MRYVCEACGRQHVITVAGFGVPPCPHCGGRSYPARAKLRLWLAVIVPVVAVILAAIARVVK
jgi:ribosomal protein L37AE/L43A